MQILRQVNEIDFKLLYTGRVCVDEIPRVKRVARVECLRLPHFLKDVSRYKRTLTEIALLNGLVTQIKRPLSLSTKTKATRRRKTNQTRSGALPRTNSLRALTLRGSSEGLTLQPPSLDMRSSKKAGVVWREFHHLLLIYKLFHRLLSSQSHIFTKTSLYSYISTCARSCHLWKNSFLRFKGKRQLIFWIVLAVTKERGNQAVWRTNFYNNSFVEDFSVRRNKNYFININSIIIWRSKGFFYVFKFLQIQTNYSYQLL